MSWTDPSTAERGIERRSRQLCQNLTFSEQNCFLQNFSKWYLPVTLLRRSENEQAQRRSCQSLGVSILCVCVCWRFERWGGRGGRERYICNKETYSAVERKSKKEKEREKESENEEEREEEGGRKRGGGRWKRHTNSDLSISQRVSSPDIQGLLGTAEANMGSNSRYLLQWLMIVSTATETWTRGSLE